MRYNESMTGTCKFILKAVLFASLLGIGLGCDSNIEVTTTTDPNLSDPDNDVAVNAGPVANLVTGDVLGKTNGVRDSILDFLDDISGDDANSGGTEKLRFRSLVEPEQPLEGTVDLSEDISCDEGGSKNIIGSADFTLEANGVTGSLVGSFTIQYDNCQDIVLLTASNGTCSVTPTVDGEVANTLDVSFTLTENNDNQQVNDNTTVEASQTTALDVAVGSTASEQTYNFSYTLSAASSATNLDGRVTFEGELFDLEDLEDFIAASSTATVCAD